MKLGLLVLLALVATVACTTDENEVVVSAEDAAEGTCSPHIHVIVHPPSHDHHHHGHGDDEEESSSHEEGGHHHEHGEDASHEEADHEGQDHEGHAASHESGEGHHHHHQHHHHGATEAEATGCNSHIHLHLSAAMLGLGRDHMGHHTHDSDHHNVLMSETDDPEAWLYAGAVLIPATSGGPTGSVAFRQRLHGGPVEAKFRARGVSMEGHDHDTMSHDHEVHVHQNGDCRQGCSRIGDGFHPSHDDDEHAAEEGYLGHVQCNMAGRISQTVTYSNEELSLVGAHSVIGRSIAIHDMGPSEDDQETDPHEGHDHSEHGGHAENPIIMCGAIVYTSGQAWEERGARQPHWWFW